MYKYKQKLVMAKKNYCENKCIAFECFTVCLVVSTDLLNSGIVLVIFLQEVSDINWFLITLYLNLLMPNDDYSGRTAPLTSKCCILYIYSTNIGMEYFKHGIYSPFFPLQNAVCFIILTYFVPVLFTFYIQSMLKLKKIIPAPKG